ncbi:MAG: hypothetical protein II994_00210 [Lachnospiraceae bacterium]|nr:hypothetical protein [Lachnospiraceae bacterium]
MREGYYGKEPLDLRLIFLRLMKKLPKILAVTLIGTLLFGGGYYVKNILFAGPAEYAVTSIYKVEYTDEPSKSGDYYINEMSWNTYIQSTEFLEDVWAHLLEDVPHLSFEYVNNPAQLAPMLEAKVASDLHIPSITVTTLNSGWTMYIAQAVEKTMMQDFAESNPQIKAIQVITPAEEAIEVEPDVRPVRAVILSAVLSFFFALTVYLIWEIGTDSIWLPATLRRRYGLPVLGTVKSKELQTNLEYRFKGMEKVAVCTVDENMDSAMIAEALKERLSETGQMSELCQSSEMNAREWIPVPAPLLCAETAELLREMDGVLLAVKAGSHAGKPLEYVLEYFAEQDIEVTATLLWEADEQLIRAYYLLPGGNRE